MSGLAKDSKEYFDFTPTGLQDSKDAIIALLKEMYNNTDSLKVNGDGWNNPYYEITGIDSEGNPINREWPNYQTYLLSDKAPDANGKLTIARDNKELPLATQFKPITESQPTNRDGIYFTLNSTGRTYVKPEPAVVAVQPVVSQAKSTAKEEFVFDGITTNTINNPDLGDIVFTVDEEGNIGLDLEASADAILELAKKKTSVGKSDEEAQNWAISNLIKAVENKVNKPTATQTVTEPVPVTPAPVVKPTAAVSDQVVNFDDATPNILETDYGTVMYFANEQGEVDINLDESADAIVNLAEQKNVDHNKAANILINAIEKKIAPQLVQQQIPNFPPVADPAPVVEEEVSDIEGKEEITPEQIEEDDDVSWNEPVKPTSSGSRKPVSYTHLRAHETG
jgi:hypothetical protein